ncbi:hypothetical protein BGX23_007484, partial [Mortierella sp. AD031]
MRSDSTRPIPPHCFCLLPAVLRAECHSIVYTCQANNINPPPQEHSNELRSPGDKDKDTGRITPGGHIASTSASVVVRPGSPRRVANPRKEYKPPDHHSLATKAAIQDIATLLTSFGKTLPPRSPSLSKNGTKDSTSSTNINTSDNNSSNSPIQQPLIPLPPPPPPKTRSVGVCGFHVHTSTWERFKNQLCQVESVIGGTGGGGGSPLSRSFGLEREKAFAEAHHQLVLRHSYLHSDFIQQARKDGCKAQMVTVTQWTLWEQEIADRSSAKWGRAAAPPVCFCGSPMKLSCVYNGQGPQTNYVCALRLQDAQHGCGRVLSSAKWAVRKKPPTIELMSLEIDLSSARTQRRRDESVVKLPVENRLAVAHRTDKINNHSQEAPTSTTGKGTDAAALTSTVDHKPPNDDPSRDTRQDSGIEVDENEAEGEDEDEGSETEWSASTPWCVNASSRRKMRLLPIPVALLGMGGRAEERNARRGSESQDGATSSTHSHSQLGHWKIHNDNRESIRKVRSLSVGQMKELYLSLEMPREYDALVQRKEGLRKTLAAERTMSEKAVQRTETRLKDWEESIERLGEYVKELSQDGLDNSTLVCRSCGQGTFLHANVPCYHLVMCDDCIKKYQRCVVCSVKIESSQRIY